MQLRVKYLFDDIQELKSNLLDSGYDVRAAIKEPQTIVPFGRATIPTGIAVELDHIPMKDLPEAKITCPIYSQSVQLPTVYSVELQVRPRSGHTARGIVAQFGTIDAGYRGEISITVFNFNNYEITIEPQERIAQLVVCPIFKPEVVAVKELNTTARGSNGFGSTGKV